MYVGGPLSDGDARTLAALRQPGSTGAALVVDPDSFVARGRRGSSRSTHSPEATVATLQSSGWMTTVVDAHTGPADAWAAVVGGRLVGAR